MTETSVPESPPAGDPPKVERRRIGQSIDIVDQAKMAELGRALKTDSMDSYVKKYPQG